MINTQTIRELGFTVIATMLAVALLLAVTGCNEAFPGLRFAPGEELRTSADATRRLADVAATDGLPPGSDATATLRQSASALAAHMGAPSTPADTDALTPPPVRDAWSVRRRQVDSLRTKHRILDASWTAAQETLTDLLDREDIDVAPDIAAALRTLRDGRAMSAAIEVPAMEDLSDAERESLDAASAALARATEVAGKQATRRPSVGQVVETGIDEVAWWIAALGLGGTGIGGTILGVKKAKDARRAAGELDVTRHDLANTEHARQYAVAKADETERTTETLVATIDAIRNSVPSEAREAMDAALNAQDANTREAVRAAKRAIEETRIKH